jgi:hypothetical protein
MTVLVFRCCIFILCGCVFLMTGHVLAADWKMQFRTKAPAAWEEYRQANRFAQGVCRMEAEASGLPKWRGECEWKINETCRSVHITDLTTGSSEIFGENQKYTFWLKSTKDQGWVIISMNLSGHPEDGQAQTTRRRLEQYGADPFEAIRFPVPVDRWIADVVSSQQSRIASAVSKQQPGGTNLVEVKLDAVPQAKNDVNQMQLFGETILLDPTRRWLPISTRSSTRNLVGTGTQTIEYEYRPGAFPQPQRSVKREEYQLNSRKEPSKMSRIRESELRVPERLPDVHDFTLSAYGLPEPVGIVWGKLTPRYVWFLIAAGSFAVLALAFRFLARRRTARVAA